VGRAELHARRDAAALDDLATQVSVGAILRRHEEKLRYVAVSGWNYVFGNLVFAALVTAFAPPGSSWLHVPMYEWMILPMNLICITNNFLGYKLLVFRTKGHYLAEYGRTYVVYAPIVAAQVFALPLLVQLLHLDPRIANPLWGFVAFAIAYFAHRLFTFRTAEERLEASVAEDDADEEPRAAR
jgi:hypothetical protein